MARMPQTSDERCLYDWLGTTEAGHDVLDDAVLGCLPDSTVAEIVDDFGVSRSAFRELLDQRLAVEGY